MTDDKIPGTEHPVGQEVIRQVLALAGDAVLVGDQSLAAWAQYFGIEPDGVLEPLVSIDLDFLGGRSAAKAISEKLHGKLFLPAPDDHVPVSTAVVTFPTEDGGYARADFLGSMAGLDPEKIRARALSVEAWGTKFLIMHPVDCLESRLANLHLLPDKRNDVGFAQARLAVRIVRAMIEKVIKSGETRHALRLVERVGDISRTQAAFAASANYGIDVLEAVPEELLPQGFREKRWPQLKAAARRKARKAKSQERTKPSAQRRGGAG